MDYRILGAILNSALYLSFVAWVGIMTGHHVATYLAIAAMGVTYLSYMAQYNWPDKTDRTNGIALVSIALGVIAGMALFA